MKNNPLGIVVALVVGVAIGYCGHGYIGHTQARRAQAADLRAIDQLNLDDIAVTLTQDPKGLLDEWSDDGVRMSPGSPPTAGKQAIAAENEKFRAQYPDFKVFSYSPNLKEMRTTVSGDWAIETGTMDAKYQLSAKDEPVTAHVNFMRLLKRQSDGTWKFAMVELK